MAFQDTRAGAASAKGDYDRDVSDEDRARWDRKYREGGAMERGPSSFLASIEAWLPRAGRALDVAGGSGRHAVWLARRGLSVTIVDVSPVGLALARAAATNGGLAIETVVSDLEMEPLPAGPWDVVLSHHYLQRSLFQLFPRLLAPGGLLIYAQPTRSNLSRNRRPPARFLLDDGELPRLVTGLHVLRHEEGWFDGVHEARLLARRES